MQEDNSVETNLSIKQYAKEIFGNEALANEWFSRHNVILGSSPKALMVTKDGEQEVRRVLACIEHGLPV